MYNICNKHCYGCLGHNGSITLTLTLGYLYEVIQLRYVYSGDLTRLRTF